MELQFNGNHILLITYPGSFRQIGCDPTVFLTRSQLPNIEESVHVFDTMQHMQKNNAHGLFN